MTGIYSTQDMFLTSYAHRNMKEDFNWAMIQFLKSFYQRLLTWYLNNLDCIDLLQNYNLLRRQKCCNLDCTKGEMLAIESDNVQQRYVLRGCWVWILAHITTNYSTFCNIFFKDFNQMTTTKSCKKYISRKTEKSLHLIVLNKTKINYISSH